MLEELLPGGNLVENGIEVIAYGSGPGSFTGLRIAASAAQGLAFSSRLPVVAVSTLSALAQTARRLGVAVADDTVLCTLDARINEVYSAIYSYENELAMLLDGPWACAPEELAPEGDSALCAIGSGCRFQMQFPQSLRTRVRAYTPDVLPAARDMIPLALEKFRRGEVQAARDVQPVYVRDEISWKKLAEQGRHS
jgi:tRNA threonylcarbamoyladenosine biosynthesis protein TsaB